MKEKIIEYYCSHIKEVSGAAIGLFFAILILTIGFFRTIFILVFVAMGYYFGKKISCDKNYLKNLLDKILPPGSYR